MRLIRSCGWMVFLVCALVAAQANTSEPLYVNVRTLNGALPAARGVALYPSGDALVSTGDRLVVVRPDGGTVVFAGGERGYVDGPVAIARFKDPAGLAIDRATGTVYVADAGNHCIRAIANGVVTTLAGGSRIGFENGRGAAATFKMPAGVAIDDSGVLYVADSGNSAIRRVTRGGDVSTLAGTGRQGLSDGAASSAMFQSPEAVAVHGGTVYVADTKNSVVRAITNGNVTTLAANGGLREPGGIAVNDDGSIVIADTKSDTIRRLDLATGTITTIAGGSLAGFLDGPPLAARFHAPAAVAASGATFVADTKNGALRVIDPQVALTSVTPATGPTAGGNTVRLFGGGFLRGATSVRFGNAQATTVEVNSSRELVAVVPAGAGTVAVTVRTAGGEATLASAYSYAQPPVVHGFAPTAARAGAVLTITGENFSAEWTGNDVRIAGAPVSVLAASANAVTVLVPPTAGSGRVSVTTSSGAASSPTAFVLVQPVGLSVTPEAVSLAPGGTAQLQAKLTFNDGSIDDVTAVATWTTSDADVATVTAGKVTAVASGQATVTASFLTFTDTSSVTVAANEPLPPDPATVAPPPNRAVVSTLAEEIEFLYTGANAIQTGVAPGTIREERAAVLRGRVISAAGAPLPGVTVTVAARPEFGQTLSRADGWYDLAVNGGGPLTLSYDKTGYINAHRLVPTRWGDQKVVDDVALMRYDGQVTRLTMPAATMQVARGSASTDDAGTRRATLLVPAGVAAVIVRADGTTAPAPTLSIRATEYSVGPNGQRAMPAELPATSAYTYCVEISADEAVSSGAAEVRFSRPVPFYLENFLGFRTGTIVPAGFYDRVKRAWIPSANGRVIAVLAVTAGIAEVDTDGDGAADDGLLLGMDLAERQTLGSLYTAGQSLWRVPIPHLTPWDCNWPYMPPTGASAPNLPRPQFAAQTENSCRLDQNSTVDCHNQTLAEAIGVTGTPFTLQYDSGRVANRNRAEIALTGSSVPQGLKRIDLTIGVAGRSYMQTFAASPNQRYTFVWDGRDAYGRLVQGTREATVSVEYVYGAVYAEPVAIGQAFAAASGQPLTVNPARQEFVYSQSWSIPLGQYDVASAGLAGWTLDAHKVYDGRGRVLYDGEANRASDPQRLDRVALRRVAGTGDWGDPVAGDRATHADLYGPVSVAAASDVSFYIAEPYAYRVHRVSADGTITTVAGTGSSGSSPDGTPAASAMIRPWDVAVGPDDALYINDQGNFRIRRISNGLLTTVAGNGTDGSSYSGPVDGQPARDVPIGPVEGITVGPDGTLYLSDGRFVRAVGAEGIIRTIAGDGVSSPTAGDGGPALRAGVSPRGLAVGPDGSVYLTNGSQELRRIRPDGTIVLVTNAIPRAWAIAAADDGSLLAGDLYERVIRRVDNAELSTFAGDYWGSDRPDGELARAAYIGYPWDVDIAPDGSVFIVDHNSSVVYRTAALFPTPSRSGETLVASAGGDVAYIFAGGRHLRTVSTLTGALVYQFGYDAAGWLVSITDGDGNVTTIERAANGLPQAIVAPGGQRTTLTVTDGTLTTIANPAGEANDFTYDARGLMRTRRDPRRSLYEYTFDSDGRLTRDADPVGGFISLERTGTMDDFTITRRSAEGREHRYATRFLTNTTDERKATAPWGLATNSTTFAASSTQTAPDGTSVTVQTMADPRFGAQSSSLGSMTVSLPSGLTKNVSATRTATLSDSRNPLSLTTLTDVLTINGRNWTQTYDAATRRISTTSPAGRQTQTTLDAKGRFATAEVPGLASASAEYDALGRLWKLHLGTRTYTFAYDAKHRVASMTDPLSRTTSFGYDLADRVIEQVLPGARTIGFGYDANGNVISVTPPSRPAHGFGHTGVNLVERYSPPGDAATSYVYDRDRRLKTVQRPDGTSIGLTYEQGRLKSINTGRDVYSYGYDTAKGTLTSVSGPDASLAFTYDGALLKRVVWSGAVSGEVAYTYDRDLRIQSENGTTYWYDADGLLTVAGALSLQRKQSNGLLEGSTLDATNDAWSYNEFAEPMAYTADVNGQPLASFTYERDAIGRIKKATETFSGSTTIRDFAYDTAGRLESVTYNGTHTTTYAYVANSNRVSKTTGTVIDSATYDAEDRLLTYGGTSYTYTASGELRTKTDASGTTTYDYDVLGNLRKVVRGDGTVIEYLIDAQNRRVGRKVDSVVTHRWLYGDQLRIVAELDATGTVASRFIYATRVNVPDYMIRAGVTYRIISDHVGSPRRVVNASTGVIVQSLTYDEFGNVLSDSNPGFQPFGFAGGLYDVATSLVRFGARDYDPRVGRWTAKDPIGFDAGDANLYGYVFGDPINFFDPTGLDALTSDATVRQYFYDLWRQSGYGSQTTERAGWILQDPATGQYGCKKWPWSAAQAQETWRGPIPANMVALAHTHPDKLSPKPSTGGTKQKPRDDYAAKQINAPVYTISRKGIWKIDPSGKITQEEGSDWMKGIKEKSCVPCQ